MKRVLCFSIDFVRGVPRIQNRIILENGVLVLGGGASRKNFDTLYPSDAVTSFALRKIQHICAENLQGLPRTCTIEGALVLIKTGTEVPPNTLPGYSRAFKSTPFEIVTGRGVRHTDSSEVSWHSESLWFLMPDDKILVVEQGNITHAGIIVTWRDSELRIENLPRAYFAEESE